MSKEEKKVRIYKPKKVNYVKNLVAACAKYKKVLLVNADNVGSSQMADIRISIRALDALLVMGKNSLMRTALNQAKKSNEKLKKLLPLIKGNCGFIFTNGSLKELKDIIAQHKKQAPAKAGSISMVDVVIPAQNTGMEPTKTSFFQALDIPTKITRGTVEIVNNFPILKVGDKVGSSEALLLQMLKIYPFSYGLKVYQVYDDGDVYDPEVLDLTDDDLLNKFYGCTAELAALSLELDLVNEATVPHSMANAFKDLLSIAVEADYSFKQAEKVKEFLKDPSKFIKVEEKKDEKKDDKQEPEEEEEEEEAPADMNLFGGGDDEEDEDDDSDDDSDDSDD